MSTLAKGIAFLSGGTILSFLLSFLAAPITSRLFPPEAFGLAALFASFGTIFGPIAGLRYDKAILLPKEDRDASQLFVLSLLWMAIITVLLFFGVYQWGPAILLKLGASALIPVLWWIPVSVALFALALPIQAWLTRGENYRVLAEQRIWKQGGASAFAITGGATGYQSGMHLAGFRLLGQIFGPLRMIHFMIRRSHMLPGGITVTGIFQQMKRYWKFPAFSVSDSLLEATGREAPVILLAFFFDPAIVGYFSRAAMLVGVPFAVLGMALEQVFYQQTSSLHANGQSIKELTERLYRSVIRYTFLPFALLCLLGPELFQFFLGSPWREAGVFAALLAPFIFFKLVVIPLGTLYNVLERQGVGLTFNLALFLVQIGALVAGGVMGNSRTALMIYTFGSIVVLTLLGAWSLRAANVPLLRSFWLLLKTSIVSGLFLVPAGMAKVVLNLSFGWVLLVATISVVVYFALHITHDPETMNLLDRIRSQLGSKWSDSMGDHD
ncbi:MAG: oligosaccharide flippase family protein [bacterium]